MPARKRTNLHAIGLKTGTDKAWHHNYTPRYEAALQDLRDHQITLLELGIGGDDNPTAGGQSLRMWAEYFTNGHIIGLDLYPKVLDMPTNVSIYAGSQNDPAVLSGIHDNHGDFDIVIDDASHVSSLTIASFELLWPRLKPGGFYVVEDTHGSYHSWFYGASEAHPNPDARLAQVTMMQFLRRLADEANFNPAQEGDETLFPREYWLGYDVESVTFSYNLCIVRKRA
jgi:hypothetical protein